MLRRPAVACRFTCRLPVRPPVAHRCCGAPAHPSTQVMVAKHGCHAAEVQHVLFCLEKLDRIMCEEGVIYPCA